MTQPLLYETSLYKVADYGLKFETAGDSRQHPDLTIHSLDVSTGHAVTMSDLCKRFIVTGIERSREIIAFRIVRCRLGCSI